MTGGPPAHRPRRARLLVLAFIVTAAVAAPSVPGVLAVPSRPSVASSPAIVPLPQANAAAVYSGTFANRAGYDALYHQEVTDPSPAAGNELVAVTFYPSTPSLFTPPAVGAPALTTEEVADHYGLSPAAYSSAQAYFESMGLTVVQTDPDRLSLSVSGTAAAVGHAFGTELEAGTYEGRPVTFPASAPGLPAKLESSVSAVVGLSSGFDLFSMPAVSPEVSLAPGETPAQGSNIISPSIARLIYDLSPLYNVSGSGSPRYAVGQGIALLLWGDGYDPNDISTFFSSEYPSSFPPPTVQAYPVDGAPPPSPGAVNDPSKAPQELTLDIEWAGSMAPGATLDAVYAPAGPAAEGYSPSVASMTDALSEAISLPGVSVLSMSFGTLENASQPLESAWATDLGIALQKQITVLAATGDLGGDAAPGCTGGQVAEYPSVSPDVIAVGGTDPTLARNLLGQITGLASESAWSGSGGGFSTTFRAPSWQEVGSAAGPISANGGRGVPDVSAAAASDSLYYDGQSGVAAGTSFATPLWAGLVTEMDSIFGSRLGFLTPSLYQVGAAQEEHKDPIGIADISSGATCLGSATTGWDPETGWGSPRALDLYEDLTATLVNITVSATPSPVAPGGTVTVKAQVASRSNGTPIAGVTVEVNLGATDNDGPCAGTWGSADLASNRTGFVSLAVAVPVCYFGSHGTANASVASSGYYGANSTIVDVNLLALVPGLAWINSYPANIGAFVVIMGVSAAVGYALGRGRRRPPRTSPAPRAEPAPRSPPPSTPGPTPPPGAVPPHEPMATPPEAPPGPPTT